MASNAKNSYLERAKKLQYNSSEYFSWFESLSQTNTERTVVTYANDVILFLEEYLKPISQLTSTYLDKYLSGSVRKGASSGIRSFFNYLNEHFNYSLNFDETLNKHRPKPKEVKKSEPLTIDQITLLRNKFYENEEYKAFLILSLVYDYGVKFKELEYCTVENFSFDNKCFSLPKREVLIDYELAAICTEHPEILKKTANYDHYFSTKMSTILEMSVTYQIMNKTRQEHLIKCPLCHREYLNDSRFWVIASKVNDVFKKEWLVCKNCAGEGERSEQTHL